MRLATIVVGLGVAAGAAAAEPAQPVARPWVPDAVFAQFGRARSATSATVGAQWHWARQWRLGERGLVSGHGEFSLGHWRATGGAGTAVVTQVGLTPTLSYWPAGHTEGWFVEAAIGVNALTPLYRAGEKKFSTAFNFGDHVAIGRRAPGARGVEWSLRLQHFSNAGIKRPNPGEDFVQLRLAWPTG